jgi:hypothetical protein
MKRAGYISNAHSGDYFLNAPFVISAVIVLAACCGFWWPRP